MKKLFFIALLSVTPLAAHAFDLEPAPTDSHGAAFADGDARLDDLPGQAQTGQALNFGGVSTSMTPGTQSDGVQTGGQLMDQGAMREYRR